MNRAFRSASEAGRGASLVTRCCGRVPATSDGICCGVNPTAANPEGTATARIRSMMASASAAPASERSTPSTAAPISRAARRWRSGLAGAVKRNTAGALRMTDMPCGSIG